MSLHYTKKITPAGDGPVIPKILRTASGSGFNPAEQAGKVADALAPNRIRDPKEPPYSAEAIANKSADSSSYWKSDSSVSTATRYPPRTNMRKTTQNTSQDNDGQPLR
ncbi:hypothetical protein V498_00218, partial [Pseudogymnoascus sp. VKM F-4517 (FW-2822)]